MAESPVIFCDTVQSVAVHNGTARIAFIRLDVEGKPAQALELLMPVPQVASLLKALQSVVRSS